MAFGLSDVGEEALIRHFWTQDISLPASVDIGLYNDSSDGLTDSDDLSAINTEPSGASYSRQSVSFGTTDMTAQDTNGDWEVDFADQTFDVSDSSQSVDGYFVVITFQSSDKSDGSATDHVMMRGSLGSTVDLSSISTSYSVTDAGMSQN